MNWIVFLRARLLRLIVVLAALTIITFSMMHIAPGDPARLVAGLDANDQVVEQTRAELGLNRSIPEQFVSYVGGIFRGDLGTSFASGESVTTEIAARIGPTLELALFGMALVLLLGVPLGILGARMTRSQGRFAEIAFSATTGALAAIPQYLVATFLVFLFALTWQIFPVSGNATLWAAVLPAVAIALRPMATITRLVRVRTLDVLESSYVRTARSKRLPSWRLYLLHVLPNSLTTMLAMAGLLFAGLVGSAVVVEIVFARPGLGSALVDAVQSNDYPVVQGTILLLGAFVVVINTLVDLVQGIVDPRTMEGSR